VLDGVPGDPSHPRRTAILLGNGDGALLVGEAQIPVGGGKLLVGHWRYTAEFDLNDGTGAAKGNSGTYVRAEMPLMTDGHRRIDAFARYGKASGRFNMFDSFASGGIKFSGWIAGRDADEFGIALASAFTSHSYRSAANAGASEIAVELTYRSQLNPWLAVQPNLHYIRNPSADPTITDALVVGLRFEANFALSGL
jgi:porin